MSKQQPSGVWNLHSNQWNRVGAPLRPSEEDGRLMLRLTAPFLDASEADAKLVVLGVTPEVVHLPWPAHVHVHAYDQSAEMIERVWRAHPTLPSEVQQVRWQELPLADGSVDCAVGDGSLNCLAKLSDYPEVLSEVARVLKDDGSMVVRMFIRPDIPESLEDVAQGVHEGRIKNFHALKWHIAMAMSVEPEFSVPVAEIRAGFERLFPDRDRLAHVAGWQHKTLDTIDAYKGVDTRYSFPTLGAVADICAPLFEIAELCRGHYELAERCPTVLFRRA